MKRYVILVCLTVNLFVQPRSSGYQNGSGPAERAIHSGPSKDNCEPASDERAAKSSPTRWYVSSEWWLVIIAALTGLAIAYQAREMKRATKVMRGQLDAMKSQITQMEGSGGQTDQLIEQAKKQVEELHAAADIALTNAEVALEHTKALVNSERPWLFIGIKTTQTRYDGNGLPDSLGFSVSFHNYGKTPAEIVLFEQRPDCRDSSDDLPLPPKYSHEGRVLAHTRMVPAGGDWCDPGESFFQPQGFLLADQWTAIQRSQKRLVYWGRLRYRDLISEAKTIHELEQPAETLIHETCFCYFWSPRINEFLICGPVGYNRHT